MKRATSLFLVLAALASIGWQLPDGPPQPVLEPTDPQEREALRASAARATIANSTSRPKWHVAKIYLKRHAVARRGLRVFLPVSRRPSNSIVPAFPTRAWPTSRP